jgi:peptidoglycan hydrolase-like protein with peptidoglycan-binding domain
VNVTTDGNGGINQDIPPKTQSGILVIQDSQTPLNNTQIPILIGNLDPVDQVSGQIARLNNLGYAAGDPSKPPVSGDGNSDGNSAGGGGDGADGASGTGSLFSTDPFSSAVQEFQCDNGLTVDGICGPVTQASLKQVHGC